MTSFLHVRQNRVTLPLGWGGQVGQILAQNMESFYCSLHPGLRDGVTDEDIHDAMLEAAKHQSHMNWYTCYAQKPATPVITSNAQSVTHTNHNSASTDVAPSAVFSSSSSAVSSPPSTPTSSIRMSLCSIGSGGTATVKRPSIRSSAAIGSGSSSSASTSAGPALPAVEDTWESINDFAEGYTD